MEQEKIKIEFTVEQLSIVVSGLKELPMKVSEQIVGMIISEYNKAKPAAAGE